MWGANSEAAQKFGRRDAIGKLCHTPYTMFKEPPVPTRNVSLTKELDRFVARCVKGGRYANASDVVRSALRSLEREERAERKMERLRAAIQEGLDSGIAEGDVFERIRKKYGLSRKVA